jgi:lipid-binding SYLF domain-containing protein
MMRSAASLLSTIVLVGLCSVPAQSASIGGWNPEALEDAKATVAKFRSTDPALETFFQRAHGYVVFPNITKGGMGIGGARGKGMVFQQGTPIGEAIVTQFTVGLQLGGQAYSEIIFFEDETTLNEFTQGRFEFSAQASAVAIKAGASADAAFDSGVAVFSMAKAGLMYEASIGGQKFKYQPLKAETN